MILWKCCIRYASKFAKLSSGHRTGKGQFSLQPQRGAILKNVQTTTQLHSFHLWARQCSKPFKLGFNSSWTENFQMCKLDLEKAEEPEILLPTSPGSSKKHESSRKTSTSASLTMLKPLTVWITTNCGKFWKRWNTRPPDLPPEKSVQRSRSEVRIGYGTTDCVRIGKGVRQGCIVLSCLFNLYAEYIMRNARLDES